MPYTISVEANELDPYRQTLESMTAIQFPGAVKSKSALLDAVTAEIIGTKQYRYGPSPGPENLVSIREVISESIANNRPIPILVPWGGYKVSMNGIDVADLMALQQVGSLYERVGKHYQPGVAIRMRLEVFTDNLATNYPDKLTELASIVVPDMSIRRESDVVSHEKFYDQAMGNSYRILETLWMAEGKRELHLKSFLPEWRGSLPDEMRDHYLSLYRRFYPTASENENYRRLSRYLGRSLARYQLKATGAEDWDKYITLAFVSTPFGRTGRRIYYRTIPERYTNNHHAPWVGKGYIRITGNRATPAVAGFNGDGLVFQPSRLRVDGPAGSISVAADYNVVE